MQDWVLDIRERENALGMLRRSFFFFFFFFPVFPSSFGF